MRGILLTAVIWGVLIVIALLTGANWPHVTPDYLTCFTFNPVVYHPESCKLVSASENWRNFIALGIIVEFLWLKSYMMAAMTLPGRFDALGVSLIAANVAFSAIYLLAMALTLWTFAQGPTAREATRDLLIVILFVGIVQLVRVADPAREGA